MKTTFSYDHYFLYDEITEICQYFAKQYPDLCKLENICTTEEKRCQWAMTVTNFKTGNPMSKPAFYIDGNHHAGEVTGSMAAMHTLDTLLSNYHDEAEITQLLDQMTFYIIPRVSPDGAETYLSTPYSLRSVNRPYHLKDGGLKQTDLDDDGVIRMMRIKDPHGAWKKGSKHSLVMEKRQPDELEGEFYNVYIEGMIENYDGLHIPTRKDLWGLDFNRNYPYGWFSEARQSGAGKYPLSNPENKAIVDFILAHPNIGAVATHHTSGGVILYPPGTRPEKTASSLDMKFYKEIGKMAKQEMGYETINIFDSFMTDQENYSSGAFDDWCYQTQGILAYTIELWDLDARAGKPIVWGKEETIEEELDRFYHELMWIEKYCPEEAIDWQEFLHPQLGLVEIGGVNYKFTSQNPPKDFLLQEVEKTTRFCLRYAKAMPRLSIEKVECTKLQKGFYKVEAIISNLGYLPTNISEEAKKLEVDAPVKVSLQGDYQLVSQEEIIDLGDLAGFGQINTGIYYTGGISTLTSDEISKKATWIIQANEDTELKITAFQKKAGRAIQTIQLS